MNANRAAYAVITTARRGCENVTRVTVLNNGGRSRLVILRDNGTRTVPLAPVMHTQISRALVDAAHAYARAAYGARRNWPTHFEITHDGVLACKDADATLGDHVFNGRVYHLSDTAITAAHHVMSMRSLSAQTGGLLRPAYTNALAAFTAHVRLSVDDRRAYSLARSVARRHAMPAVD